MRYMIKETSKDTTGEAVYARFAAKGRMQPDGLTYIDSWIRSDRGRCFQLMVCDNPKLLQDWMSNWNDLVTFEVVPIVSYEAANAMTERAGA